MPHFTVIDAVDIVVVAFGIYKLMALLRGTRATAIVKGLGLLFAVTLLSAALGLRTVNWLLDRGTTALFVALPVVFYPELRRALEQLGRGQLFRPGRLDGGAAKEETLTAVAEAAAHLAEGRIGGLIVLERDIGLGEFIASGTAIDGRVSASLLENVFVPNTPLHDGAAILRGGRLAAAGCFLPLTESLNVSALLGTRHRAGIGISEQSDAVAVIVSEENGSISLAVEGRLVRHLDRQTLKARLDGIFNARYARSEGRGGA